MIDKTFTTGTSKNLYQNYLKNLVNCFFKILPMRENNEDSLLVYMEDLQTELIGFDELVEALDAHPGFMSLISNLEYLINHPECSLKTVKRKVFNSISICNKMSARLGGE